MRGLRILVVVMGVLIIGGTVTLVVLLVQRAGGQRTSGQQASGPSVGGQRAGGQMWELPLGQPDGARVGGIAAAEGVVAVWIMRPEGDRVMLVDPRRGQVAGEIRLR